MSVVPPDLRSAPPAGALAGPKRGKSALTDDSQSRISMAEREAEAAERDSASRVEHARDTYERQSSMESANQESALESQKAKGYEAIRELQRQQQAELSRIRREGERQISQLDSHYRDTAYASEKHGKEQLQEIQSQQGRQIDFAQRSAQDTMEDTRSNQTQRYQQFKEEGDRKLSALTENYRQEYDRLRENSSKANEQTEKRFDERYRTALAQQDESINEVNQKAANSLYDLRSSTAQKLAAYSDRSRDPFYKLVRLDADLSDNSDAYVLTATIPEHEQEHVTVILKGNNLVVAGVRRNEEHQEVAPGHVQGTSTYQSFNESFPLAWPVDAKRLSFRFEGDQLIATAPKKAMIGYEPYKATTPQRARAERPKFPGNLPGPKAEAAKDEGGDRPSPSRKERGTGTLS